MLPFLCLAPKNYFNVHVKLLSTNLMQQRAIKSNCPQKKRKMRAHVPATLLALLHKHVSMKLRQQIPVRARDNISLDHSVHISLENKFSAGDSLVKTLLCC